MPPAPPPNRPQTIKQAKAAYKSRGQPSLTEKEKRQLERSIELDRRAWRSKEADKRKAEAAKKRLEKEKKQSEELGRVRLGSQRRCDRYGYKSSQTHLGAFLNKRNVRFEEPEENLRDVGTESEEEGFGDDDLDDETLLDAMARTEDTTTRTTHYAQAPTTAESPQTRLPAHNTASTNDQTVDTSAHEIEDLESLWEDLDSGTQIARDLASEECTKAETKPTSKASSFSSGDFDLTIEDMELLDPPPPAASKLEHDRRLMPPPPLPVLRGPPTAEFTMSQLEQFVDDDLQLTQAEPD
jgi:hypothetical protein